MESVTIDRDLDQQSRTKHIEYDNSSVRKSVPQFGVSEVVAPMSQENTAHLANYAHNLRRSYFKFGEVRGHHELDKNVKRSN